jgi:DNA-binding response OmpR family regulator
MQREIAECMGAIGTDFMRWDAARNGPVGGHVDKAVRAEDKRIDLMITDVRLPGGMNGRQVADAARILQKDLKVLFITGYAKNAAVGNGRLEAGMAILTKPFAMATLVNKVHEMIEG